MRVEYGGNLVYQSQPKQYVFYTAYHKAILGEAPPNILYGGAAGGGKTEALLWAIYDLATWDKWPKLRIGVFRKTFPEIEKYFIQRALDVWPNPEGKVYKYSESKHRMKFANGTIVEFNYCEADTDVISYQGAQFDVLIIDELTHHTEYRIKYLLTRLRTSKPGWKPLFLAATNPGNVGHAFVKRWFVLKDEYKEGEGTAKDYLFIPAKIWDNEILLLNDPSYLRRLQSLGDADRRALLEGDWNIFAGQYFTELRTDIHGFDPFLIPQQWPRFLALDYGYKPHPAAAGWFAVGEDENLYLYKTLLKQRRTYKELAADIVVMSTPEEIKWIKDTYVVADPSIFAKRGQGEGKSGAEEMAEIFDKIKWNIYPADNNRVIGWNIMRQFLSPYRFDGKLTAKLKIANSCKDWWKSVPQLQHDPNRPEDIKKMNVTEDGSITDGDDLGDMSRYAIMSRHKPPQSKKKETQKTDRYGYPIKDQNQNSKYKVVIDRSIYKGKQ